MGGRPLGFFLFFFFFLLLFGILRHALGHPVLACFQFVFSLLEAVFQFFISHSRLL
jgi:hypothetical protein